MPGAGARTPAGGAAPARAPVRARGSRAGRGARAGPRAGPPGGGRSLAEPPHASPEGPGLPQRRAGPAARPAPTAPTAPLPPAPRPALLTRSARTARTARTGPHGPHRSAPAPAGKCPPALPPKFPRCRSGADHAGRGCPSSRRARPGAAIRGAIVPRGVGWSTRRGHRVVHLTESRCREQGRDLSFSREPIPGHGSQNCPPPGGCSWGAAPRRRPGTERGGMERGRRVVQEAAELAGSAQGRGDSPESVRPPGNARLPRGCRAVLPGQRCPLGAAGCSSSSSLPMPHNGCPWGAGPGSGGGAGLFPQHCGEPTLVQGARERRGPSVGSYMPRCTDGFFVAAWPGASSRQTLRLDSPAVAAPSPGSSGAPHAGWVPSGCSRAQEGFGPAPGMSHWGAAALAVLSTSLLPSA